MLTLAGNFVEKFGYGNLTASIARGLMERGYDVRIHPILTDVVPPDLVPFIVHCEKADVTFWGPRDHVMPARFLFSMWETDTIDRNAFSDYDEIIVPCRHNKEVFGKYTQKPIHICPLGADGTYVAPKFDPFVFTTIGADHGVRNRKRIQDTIYAFQRAFPDVANVRLVVKQSPNSYICHNFDTRVQVIRHDMPRAEVDQLVKDTTVGVAIGGMEGWGLPANEFIAHGKPVISPLVQGHADILDMTCAFALDYELKTAPIEKPYCGYGLRPWVSISDVAEQMRFAYENPYEVMRRSIAAFHKAQQLTVDNMVNTFIKIVYGRSKRSSTRNRVR